MKVDGGALYYDSILNNSKYMAALRQMEDGILGTTRHTEQEAAKMDAAFNRLSATLAGVFSIAAAQQFVMQLINVRGEFQQLEIAFTTMLGSKEKSDALMKDITQFAATTPFDLKQVASGTKQLLAYGFAAQDMNENLSMLGNVASGVGSQIGDLIYLYGTLRASGRVTQMDINQFAGRGIPIYAELAKVLGVNVEQVREFVSAGKIGFADIEKAFKGMTNQSGMFYNLMQEQSKSLTGQISNLGDAFDSMLNEIGKSNEGILYGGIEAVASLVENYEKVLDIIKVLLTTYGVYKAALYVTLALEKAVVTQRVLTNAVTLTYTNVTRAMTVQELLSAAAKKISTRAQVLLNASVLANPYVAAATALAALVTALVVFSNKVDEATLKQENLNNVRENANKSVVEQKLILEDLLKTANNENLSLQEREKALEKINGISPEFLGNLDLQKLKTDEGRKAIEEYNKSIDLMALKQASFDKRVEIQKQKSDLLSGKAEDKIGFWSRSWANIKKGKSGDFNKAEYDKIRNEQVQSLDNQLKDISDYEQKEIEKFNNKPVTPIELKRSVKVIDEDIEALKEKQKTASNNAEFKIHQAEIDKLEKQKAEITGNITKTEKKGADDKIKILEEITKAENEAHLNKLQSDEREIQSTKLKYEELRKEARKAGLGPGAISRIDRVEKSDLGYLEYDRETEKLELEISKQKEIFQQYEEYRISLGKDAADKRFESEKAAYDDYGKYIKSKMSEFVGVDLTKLTSNEKTRYDNLKKESDDYIKLEEKKYDDLLKSLISYDQQRKLLTEKYNIDFAILQTNPKAQAELTKKYQEDLKFLDESQIKKWESYKNLFDHLEDLNRKELANRIQLLKDKVAAEVAAGNITIDQANKVYREINAIGRTKDGAGLELVIQRLRTVAGEISSINNDIGSIVGSLANAAVNYMSIAKDIKTMNDSTASQQDQDAAKIGLYAQAANGLLSIVSGITNAAAERKRVTEEFYRSAINFQNQYNLTLIEQARLDSINKRGIFSKDSLAEIKDGVKASGLAMTEYQKKLDDLAKGQAKTGLRNAVDWKSVGSMTATGVATGAAIGSIIPVVGTAIGAVVGGVVGFVGGLFGTKKKKDTYAGLLSEFPELIMKSADGTRVLNTGLAQQLIAQNKVNTATKDYLQAAIDAEKGLAAAREQVNEGIKTLVGSIDDDLRNSLVNAFKAGEDGMKAFESTVGNSMENIIANLAFQAIFNDAFKELEDGMKDSFGLGGDNNIVDDLESFYKLYGSLTKDFDAALTAASQAAKQSGIDIFTKGIANESGLKGSIKRELTEQTASELTGLYRATYDLALRQYNLLMIDSTAIKNQNDLLTRQLFFLSGIEQHTLRTANNTDLLSNKLDQIITNTKPGQTTRDMGI
jgi:tape measure domain-containing protein